MGTTESGTSPEIPFPIVALNRAVIVVSVLVALVFRQPWITTLLFVVVAAAVVLGPRGSLIFQVGRRTLRGPIAMAVAAGQTEAPVLMRFNNSLAVIMLALAQISFLLGWTLVGWIFAGMVALAATVALAGFCVGCYIFPRVRLMQYRLRQMPEA